MTAQLGGVTPNEASSGPWSSFPVNTGVGWQMGIVRDSVTVKAMVNKLGGRKLAPAVFHFLCYF